MKYEKNRKIAGIDEYKLQKVAKILLIPAVVLLLILVILIVDRFARKNSGQTIAQATTLTATPTEAEETSTEEEAAADAPDNNVYLNDFSHYGLQRDAVPEVKELVLKYQRAKTTGDAELMYETFGRTDAEGLEVMQEKLSAEAEVYEAFEDTVCYTTKGVQEGSYLAYISCNARFAGIDTPAPMLMWAYVVRDADGNYHMKEPNTLTPAEEKLLNEVSSSEDVALLDSEMRSRLAQAVIQDAKLASLYQMWTDTENADEMPEDPDALVIRDDSVPEASASETEESGTGTESSEAP